MVPRNSGLEQHQRDEHRPDPPRGCFRAILTRPCIQGFHHADRSRTGTHHPDHRCRVRHRRGNGPGLGAAPASDCCCTPGAIIRGSSRWRLAVAILVRRCTPNWPIWPNPAPRRIWSGPRSRHSAAWISSSAMPDMPVVRRSAWPRVPNWIMRWPACQARFTSCWPQPGKHLPLRPVAGWWQ